MKLQKEKKAMEDNIRKEYGRVARDILQIVEIEENQKAEKKEGKINDKYDKSSFC